MIHVYKIFSVAAIFLFLNVAGCSVSKGELHKKVSLYSTGNGVVSIYLDTDGTTQSHQLKFHQLELYSQGIWYPVSKADNHATTSVSGHQRLLALDSLPANDYSRVRFKIDIVDDSGELLRSQHSELPLTDPLQLKKSDSRCLFIRQQLTNNPISTPIHQWLTVSPQQVPLTDELLYILCPDIHTLYLARVDQYRIVAAYPLEGDVVDMVLDEQRRLLYLLDKKNLFVQRYDTSTQQLTDRIPLPLMESPKGIELSADGETLYVIDPFNRQLLSINAFNGTLKNSANIGYDPTLSHWYKHNDTEYLALISKTDQQLIVVNASTLNLQFSNSAGQTPQDIIYADESLFVTDQFNHHILKFSPETGQQLAKISTNGSPQFLEVDPINQNILITLKEKSITFLPFGQQMTVRKAACNDNPGDLVISNNRRLLFVANPDIRKITILDLLSQQQLSTLDVGSSATVLAVQEP